MAEDKNKIENRDGGVPADIRFIVMPEEFRKVPPKKKMPPKIVIAGGIFVIVFLIAAGAVVLITYKPTAREQIVATPEATIMATTSVVGQAATSTETTASLFSTPATTTSETTVSATATTETLAQGADTDADGLSDKEEAIFQTDTKRPDSDADGYLDGNEAFHLYNPSAIAPAGLLESGIVRLYRNASWGYQIYYPSLWTASSTTDGSAVSYAPIVGAESISIAVKNTDASTALRSWYLSQYPNADINLLQTYTSKKGYQGLQDGNRLNTYIKQGGKVFITTYDLGENNTTVWYRRLYDMMLNSLKID
jgi:hypothetical protein